MLSTGLANYMLSTFYLCPDVCACAPLAFVPWLLVLYHCDSPYGLLLMDHAHLCVCKNNICFAYQLAPDSVNFAVMEKKMQSVNLICRVLTIVSDHAAASCCFLCVFIAGQVTKRPHTSAVSPSRERADHCRERFMTQPACNC